MTEEIPQRPRAAYSQRGRARQALTNAITRSCDASTPGDPDARATHQHVFAAELRLRAVGCEALAERLASALRGDLTTAATRAEIREVAQLIDARGLSGGGFEPASDRGERR
jgi:hypothetical protein